MIGKQKIKPLNHQNKLISMICFAPLQTVHLPLFYWNGQKG